MFSTKRYIAILIPLSLMAAGCESKNPPAPQPTPSVMASTTASVPAVSTSPSPVADNADPNVGDPDAMTFDCGMKIHVANFEPRDKGGPIGNYTAKLIGGDVLTGTVENDGTSYVFLTGNLGQLNTVIDSDDHNQYSMNEGGLITHCTVV